MAEWKEPLAEAMRIKGKIKSYAKVDELKGQDARELRPRSGRA